MGLTALSPLLAGPAARAEAHAAVQGAGRGGCGGVYGPGGQPRPFRSVPSSPHPHTRQCYLVTHVIFTLNNWGELHLPRELLAHEYLFLRQYLDLHVRRGDVHLVRMPPLSRRRPPPRPDAGRRA